MAVQTFIGAPGESRSLELLCRTADAGARYGIPTLGVVAVGKQMERTEKFFQLATRVLAENGAYEMCIRDRGWTCTTSSGQGPGRPLQGQWEASPHP